MEISELCQEGLILWFNMDFRQLAELLLKSTPVKQCRPLPARLLFLQETLLEESSLEEYERLYTTFLAQDDLEAAYACSAAALGSIWSSGRDFHRYVKWLARSDALLQRIGEASPLAIASLLGFKALAELTGEGNLDLALMPYTVQQFWAEKSGSPSLRLLHVATAAHCSLWRGDLASAELLLGENFPLHKRSQASTTATFLYRSCLGLSRIIGGDTIAGIRMLASVAKPRVPRFLPQSVYLHLCTNYLHGLCISGQFEQVEKLADEIMEKAVQPCNYYHLAHIHYCLGIAALRLGKPRRALLHSEAAARRGEMSASHIIPPFAALLRGLVMIELHQFEQALHHFGDWLPRWHKKGFALFTISGTLEMAAVYLQLEKYATARLYFDRAKGHLVPGERLFALYRHEQFVPVIEHAIEAAQQTSRPTATGVFSPVVIQIQTFGTFRMTVLGKRIYDRNWKGRRAKQLLKAIIALGGTRVSLEKLCYLLWPDSDGDQGLNALKTTLSRLRKVGCSHSAPSNWLVVKHRRVSLVRSVCTVDALEFYEQMATVTQSPATSSIEDVLDLYGDDFLPDDSDAWVITFRNQLRSLFIEGVLSFSARNNGEKNNVLSLLERANRLAPLHEGVYAALMEHYLESGYPAQALDIFQRAEQTISRYTPYHTGPKLLSLADQAKRAFSRGVAGAVNGSIGKIDRKH